MRPPIETDEFDVWSHDADDFAAARGIAVGLCLSVAAWIVIGALVWAAF